MDYAIVSLIARMGIGGHMEIIKVRGVSLLKYPVFNNGDAKVLVDEHKLLPFPPKRTFQVYESSGTRVRGEHAHRYSRQIHRVFGGSVTFYLNDGANEQEIVLSEPNVGLLVEPWVWQSYLLQNGALLIVVSSASYDPDDYIYKEEFERQTKKS